MSHPRVPRGFPRGSAVKNLPALQQPQERRAGSLGQEDPLQKEMPTHSSILAWGIQWIEKSGDLYSLGSQRVRHNLATKQ